MGKAKGSSVKESVGGSTFSVVPLELRLITLTRANITFV
jgi:hypothetical protein